ncbi:RDD family protein [Acetobacter thailandicus]|uniref:RDD family protein n=1 Tax=Acetobacter thailandicus TaxID=1502842 RepID=UPI001BAB0140|nr:RDD family protein [Acetobacter thailandicus]MBS0980269.1 RDD family protein [Acetobacter thailandicus]
MTSDLPPGWNSPASTGQAAPIMTQNTQEHTIWVYAGFWWRVFAFTLDYVFFNIIGFFVGLALKPSAIIQWHELSLPGTESDEPGVTNVASFMSDGATILVPHLQTAGLHQFSLVMFLLIACYCILFEASPYRGTPGMKLCRIEVVTTAGKQVSVLRAALRFFVKTFLSFPLFFIGVIMVGLTPRKQGLHDIIADTLVIRRRREQDVIFTQHS